MIILPSVERIHRMPHRQMGAMKVLHALYKVFVQHRVHHVGLLRIDAMARAAWPWCVREFDAGLV